MKKILLMSLLLNVVVAQIQNESYTLRQSDGSSGFRFGYSVKLVDGYAVVASNNVNGNDTVPVIVYSTASGSEIRRITPTATVGTPSFYGRSLDATNTHIIVGSYYTSGLGIVGHGSAYVFDFSTGNQLHELTLPDLDAYDHFGSSVAISGNYAVVSAGGKDLTGIDSGCAYVFDTGTGTNLHRLVPNDSSAYDFFGYDANNISIFDDKVAISAAVKDVNGYQNAGAVYIFDLVTGEQINKIISSSPAANDNFGKAVALTDTRLVVTSNSGASFFNLSDGNEYRRISSNVSSCEISGDYVLLKNKVFHLDTGVEMLELTTDGSMSGFGSSVSLNGGEALIGTPGSNDNGSGSGSAYFYSFDETSFVKSYEVAIPFSANGSVTGGGIYEENSPVTLTATPNAGFVFVGWTGDVSSCVNPLSLNSSQNLSINALFTPVACYDQITANAETQCLLDIANDPQSFGYYTASQMLTLCGSDPCIEKDTSTGDYKLTLQFKRSNSMSGFTPINLNANQVTVDSLGNLEIRISPESNEDSAFYRYIVE